MKNKKILLRDTAGRGDFFQRLKSPNPFNIRRKK